MPLQNFIKVGYDIPRAKYVLGYITLHFSVSVILRLIYTQ
jgi:hypothetical protein